MAQPNPISVLHDLKDAHVHHHMDRSSRTRHGQPGHSGNLIHVNCMNVSQMSSQHKDMSSRRRNGQPSHSGNLIHANCMNVSQMSSHHKDISSRRRLVQPSDYGHVFLSPAKQKRKRQSNDEEIKQRFMEQWRKSIKVLYPRLQSQTYTKPPVHFNRVSYREQKIGDVVVKKLIPSTQLSNVRENESQQRVQNAFSRLLTTLREVMMVIFELDFDNYLNNAGNAYKRETKQRACSAKPGHAMCRGYNSGVYFYDERPTENGVVHTSDHDGSSTAEPDLSVFPRPRDLDSAYQRGKFDILIIHRQHGIMIFEVKAVGDAFGLSDTLNQSIDAQYDVIRKKVERSLKQLDKEEKVLRYLLQDLGTAAANIPVTKGLILPNLRKQTVHAALMQDFRVTEYVCQCLKAKTLEDALQKCIFSDQLPPMGNSLDISDDIIKTLQSDWWSRLTGGASSDGLSEDLYESIIARFCVPATTQFVPTAYNPRAEVSTLPLAVLETSRCFTAPVLTDHQVDVLNADFPRVYLTGSPGTGKTLMLILKAHKWLQQGKTVLVTSLWDGGEAISQIIHQKVTQESGLSSPRLRLLLGRSPHFEDILSEIQIRKTPFPSRTAALNQFYRDESLLLGNETAIVTEGAKTDVVVRNSTKRTNKLIALDSRPSDLVTHRGRDVRTGTGVYEFSPTPTDAGPWLGGRTEPCDSEDKQDKVHMVIDEAPWFLDVFVKKLEALLGKDRVVILAASSLPGWKPNCFKEVVLTQSLRCPPVVVREMTKTSAYFTFARHSYTALDAGVLSGMPSPTDGPPVKRIHHHGHKDQRGTRDIWDCQDCGAAVATFLTNDLGIRTRDAETTEQQQQTLHFSDVIVSGYLPFLGDVTVDMAATISDGDNMEWMGNGDLKDLHRPTMHKANAPGFLRGLQKGTDTYIPVEIIKKGDHSSVQKLAASENLDLVQIAEPESIMGLERAVVIVMGTTDLRATFPRHVDPCFDVMARCTSQLVIVGEMGPSLEDTLREKLTLTPNRDEQKHGGCF